ncbi:hypothetical protein HK096_004975 [Nowakowskiella sp. JEL0078]|nr:hypothetical protein HK096_004975 [Nowakowskiella sp. JEL0078]
MTSSGRRGYGLIGYGITMYQPPCAFSCRDVISSAELACSTMDHDMSSGSMDMMTSSTTPQCFASDDAFLRTLAWCISKNCNGLPLSQIEHYWEKNVAGHDDVQPNPKESYQTALAKVTVTPSQKYTKNLPLNVTMLVPASDYEASYNALSAFENIEIIHERFGLILLTSGVLIPIGASLVRFIPFPSILVGKFYAVFVDPPLFGSSHRSAAIFGLGLVPTRGQSIIIVYLIAINVILSSIGIQSVQPNSWWPGDWQGEIIAYVANRAGVLSFANIPLLLLYSSRNNILLWITNWDHSTFLIIHRWVAAIATIQASIHSALYLQMHWLDHATESHLPYWIWGIVATLGMCILLPTSILPFRQKMYEVFLAWHIAISVLVVAGCYMHIAERFGYQWGYELWILVAIAVWLFDRGVRLLKIARNGVRTAIIRVFDEDYVRIDVLGVTAKGHAYLYFPTLTWRVWENHPLSIASSVIISSPQKKNLENVDIEKEPLVDDGSHTNSNTVVPKAGYVKSKNIHKRGLTFFVRMMSGQTAKLRTKTTLPVLVESSYGSDESFLAEDLSSYPNLICIAGGVGVTAVIHHLQGHKGSAKLYWSVRKSGIAEELDDFLEGVDKEIFIGSKNERLQIPDVLERDLISAEDDVVVVVCGPAGMADEVRAEVTKLAKKSKVGVKLVEESFSW